MRSIEILKYGCYYHIFNRGINGENLFNKSDNYLHFLKLYDKYIEPVAETFAWCLMPNHFHFLVRIKDEKEINPMQTQSGLKATDWVKDIKPFQRSIDPESGLKKPTPYRQFSHLFNAYAQAYNKANYRHGSLLEKPFKRKLISNHKYCANLVQYIHNNPVAHGFCEQIIDYPWSSYHTVLSNKETKLKRFEVIEWFGDLANFKYCHKNYSDLTILANLIIE